MNTTIHLIDLLPRGQVNAPAPGYVEVQNPVLGREGQMALFQHPASRVDFPALTLGQRPMLRFACGVRAAAWERIVSQVIFVITINTRGQSRILFEHILDPRRRVEHRRWLDFEIDLGNYAGQPLSLAFATRVPPGQAADFAWAVWGDPRIEHETAARPQPRGADSHPHIFFITATALGAWPLALYGGQVATPRLHQLAQDGVLFEQAWSQSSTTPGSYASWLTGVSQPRHGIDNEWRPFPHTLPNLVSTLRGLGWHSTLIASQTEIDAPEAGFSAAFDETVLSRANPSQDGAVTLRAFERWLAARPDRPCFTWIELFDTHPPLLMREPYRSMFYDGDPTAQRIKSEQIARIHGMESVKTIMAYLPYVEQGIIPMELTARLRETAFSLVHGGPGPDLAAHLRGLGAPACKGLSPAEFGRWLGEQLVHESMTPAVLAWMKDALPRLRTIEADLLNWLHDVTDFRYPAAQYLGAAAYVDALVGRVIDLLQAQGIYEQSTVIFTSPHGEIIDAQGEVFGHHLLHPMTLHVPLIIRPAADVRSARGQRVGGVFDAVDFFPTQLDLLGAPPPEAVEGTSRLDSLRDGASIPAHDSFSSDLSNTVHGVYRPPLLLLQAQGAHVSSSEWLWAAGQERLFSVAGQALRPVADTAEEEALRARLAAWLERG